MVYPISTSYVVADTTPAVEDMLIGTLYRANTELSITVQPGMDNPKEPDDYSYVHLPKARASTNIHFAYQHIGNKFLEINTNTTYRLYDIVKLTNRDSVSTPCFQFFDTSMHRKPPDSASQYENEPTAQFFSR